MVQEMGNIYSMTNVRGDERFQDKSFNNVPSALMF